MSYVSLWVRYQCIQYVQRMWLCHKVTRLFAFNITTYHVQDAGITSLIARFMGPTWVPSGADRTQVGPMWAPWHGPHEPCYLGILSSSCDYFSYFVLTHTCSLRLFSHLNFHLWSFCFAGRSLLNLSFLELINLKVCLFTLNYKLKSHSVLHGILYTRISSSKWICFVNPSSEITSENLKQCYLMTIHGFNQLPLMGECCSSQLSTVLSYIVSLLLPTDAWYRQIKQRSNYLLPSAIAQHVDGMWMQSHVPFLSLAESGHSQWEKRLLM